MTDDKPFSYDLYMDKSVRPGDDFFRYACGKWIDTSERPSMYLHYAMGYNDLDMLTNYAWDLCENLRNFGFTEERITEIHKNAMV